MKSTGLVLIQIALLFYHCLNVNADTELIDRIVAVVNDEIITFSELNKSKTLMQSGMPSKVNSPDFDRKLLSQMIDKKIIVQEAKNLDIHVKKKEIDTAIENVLERNKITLKTLKEGLAQQGTTLEEYREMMKEDIIQSHVVGRQVHANITITEDDIRDYYEKNIKPKEKPGERVRIQQILLLAPKKNAPETEEAIEKSINEIRERILSGENFGKLAAAFSQGPAARAGGDLGYFHRGELMPAIENAAFSMKKGEVSSVIKTTIGFHLIKLINIDKTEKDRSWKDHIDEIEGILYNQKFENNYLEWLKGLREKSYIEINY